MCVAGEFAASLCRCARQRERASGTTAAGWPRRQSSSRGGGDSGKWPENSVNENRLAVTEEEEEEEWVEVVVVAT